MENRATLNRLMIRTLLYIYFGAALVGSVGAETSSTDSNDFDHLIPVGAIIEPRYDRLLTERLFVGSIDVLRITTIPPSTSGETGIAIQDRIDSSDQMFVTCTKAKKNLWSAAKENVRKSAENAGTDINRVEASLPKSTAIAVIDGVKRTLGRIRPPTKTETVILDGTMIQFCVRDRRTGTMRGLLDQIARGKDSNALRQIVRLLETYCHAKPARRSALARQLEMVAKGI